ncbi:uncharacterized protein RSE6_04317 [Rhynchosporium secalis]|uniref:Uncharacterized protein n=1 Tax=Rhynchosporium secalis TaxID=38038 RepID=A0A1E1M506_RHYSE|nr:uncharacterized protein RSE6_04317 [Rhynchosporium secalis]
MATDVLTKTLRCTVPTSSTTTSTIGIRIMNSPGLPQSVRQAIGSVRCSPPEVIVEISLLRGDLLTKLLYERVKEREALQKQHVLCSLATVPIPVPVPVPIVLDALALGLRDLWEKAMLSETPAASNRASGFEKRARLCNRLCLTLQKSKTDERVKDKLTEHLSQQYLDHGKVAIAQECMRILYTSGLTTRQPKIPTMHAQSIVPVRLRSTCTVLSGPTKAPSLEWGGSLERWKPAISALTRSSRPFLSLV